MATITASLERSLQNCSLNHQSTTTTATATRSRNRRGPTRGGMRSPSPDSSSHHHNHQHLNQSFALRSDGETIINNNNIINQQRDYHVTHSNASSSDDNSTFVELNSHVSLPYHWEQCLDLKTGELYYVNWSNGMKAKEDPRTTATGYNGDYYSEDDEQEEEEEEEEENDEAEEEEEEESYAYDSEGSSTESNSAPSSSSKCRSVKRFMGSRKTHQIQPKQLTQDSVLVVAGCKSCLMYHMVPRHLLDCPKCSGQLLHFAANTTPSSP